MAKRIYVEESSHSNKVGWVGLAVISISIVYSNQILAIGIMSLIVAIIVAVVVHLVLSREAEQWKELMLHEQLSVDADIQNELWANGDPAGMYGRYDAYTMPLTENILDNYNDGLKEWR